MKKVKQINRQRKNRAFRVSNTVKKYSTRPRLAVFRSNANIYAQIIDDESGKTLAAAGTRDKDLKGGVANGGNCDAATKVGENLAKKALAAGIKQVAFDRHGFKYHGRLRSLADAARKAGLDIGSDGAEKFAAKAEAKAQKKPKDNAAKASKTDKTAAKAAAGKAQSAKKK